MSPGDMRPRKTGALGAVTGPLGGAPAQSNLREVVVPLPPQGGHLVCPPREVTVLEDGAGQKGLARGLPF